MADADVVLVVAVGVVGSVAEDWSTGSNRSKFKAAFRRRIDETITILKKTLFSHFNKINEVSLRT